MQVSLYDSLKREVLPLSPARADGVFRFYNCGPTVYAPAHIGNFRTFIVNDLIRRLLELQLGKEKVLHVRNITDVDDKTIRRSREEGKPLGEVTGKWARKFWDDCEALNCLRPHQEPTATGNIGSQIDMISVLERKGHAYRTGDGSVYFKVASFAEYGALSRLKERSLKEGAAMEGRAHAADADEKEDGSDFALWKAHKDEDGEVFWESPWGKGRPGWHIECSAMSKAFLGETIDLHTGGIDLLFPHHENEIAQSECCNGVTFSRRWYHSEHLLVDGRKMSKSLGNLYTLDQLREKGVSADAVRYALLMGHPRKQLNFTLDSLEAAEKALGTIRNYRKALAQGGAAEDGKVFEKVLKVLCDDLNTPGALGELFGIIHAKPVGASVAGLDRVLFALGIRVEVEEKAEEVPAEVKELAEKRWAAKSKKDFAAADALRKEIAEKGWTMLDAKDGFSLKKSG